MNDLRCLVRLHHWQAMKWGVDWWLDARECQRCGRWEIWILDRFYPADRAAFPNALARLGQEARDGD